MPHEHVFTILGATFIVLKILCTESLSISFTQE
jgi:hypothetical protein